MSNRETSARAVAACHRSSPDAARAPSPSARGVPANRRGPAPCLPTHATSPRGSRSRRFRPASRCDRSDTASAVANATATKRLAIPNGDAAACRPRSAPHHRFLPAPNRASRSADRDPHRAGPRPAPSPVRRRPCGARSRRMRAQPSRWPTAGRRDVAWTEPPNAQGRIIRASRAMVRSSPPTSNGSVEGVRPRHHHVDAHPRRDRAQPKADRDEITWLIETGEGVQAAHVGVLAAALHDVLLPVAQHEFGRPELRTDLTIR